MLTRSPDALGGWTACADSLAPRPERVLAGEIVAHALSHRFNPRCPPITEARMTCRMICAFPDGQGTGYQVID
ncbi:MAG: hypothetical protein ABIS03_12180 [Gemmatimonadaceae bacterium]